MNRLPKLTRRQRTNLVTALCGVGVVFHWGYTLGSDGWGKLAWDAGYLVALFAVLILVMLWADRGDK